MRRGAHNSRMPRASAGVRSRTATECYAGSTSWRTSRPSCARRFSRRTIEERHKVTKQPTRVFERIGMTRSELETIEHDILRRRHVERYAIVRQFVYGRVVDCACG